MFKGLVWKTFFSGTRTLAPGKRPKLFKMITSFDKMTTFHQTRKADDLSVQW